MAKLTVSQVGVGTPGNHDWSYPGLFPIGGLPNNIIHNAIMSGLPVTRLEQDGESLSEWEAYLGSQMQNYYDYAGLEGFLLKDNFPQIGVTNSYKLAAGRVGSLIVVYANVDNNIIEAFSYDSPWFDHATLDNGYAGLLGRVALYNNADPINPFGRATLLNESFNTNSDAFEWPYWMYSVPYFNDDEDLEAYLKSPDADWTNFGGVDWNNGDDNYDYNISDNIDGIGTDAGFDTANGLCRLAILNDSQVQDLAKALGLGFLANNIGDGIISLKYIRTPFAIQSNDEEAIIKTNVLVGNIFGRYIPRQFQAAVIGEMTVGEFFGDFLDYTNSRVSIYLPFCGVHDLDARLIFNSKLSLTCAIDFLTGTCIYYLKIVKEQKTGSLTQYLYTWTGNCSMEVPISAIDYAQKITQFIGGVVSLGVGVKSGHFGELVGGTKEVMTTLSDQHVQTGVLASNPGWYGIMYPYLIIYRSDAIDVDYADLAGRPAEVCGVLNDFSGYTSISNIHLDGVVASQAEIAELENILKSGVYI